jgi:hypothetical protein
MRWLPRWIGGWRKHSLPIPSPANHPETLNSCPGRMGGAIAAGAALVAVKVVVVDKGVAMERQIGR